MKRFIAWLFLVISTALFSCGVTRDIPKYSFSDGYYYSKIFAHKESKVYVDNSADSIYVYAIAPGDKSNSIDTLNTTRLTFPQQYSSKEIPPHTFRQFSFDIDFLTIPFKYRSPAQSLPSQFNTNLNGAVYFGYRVDIYRHWYKRTPINGFNRQINHYGFSYGFFNGLGGTAINPWVTENMVSSEYDGVVWSKGFTGIIGIDNFTVGLALGWDHLLEKNKKYWIYQRRPWLGLAFGLNLN